jgi:type IV pilus assembly protein PilA
MEFLRKRFADREAGFTLIELLIVMLVLANLAAIAIPTFLNQKRKATDSGAKQIAHSAQVAMETCSVNNGGVYSAANCGTAALRLIEPSIPATNLTAEPNVPTGGYTIAATAPTGNTYTIRRETSGSFAYPCTVATTNRGACPGAGTAAGIWGT